MEFKTVSVENKVIDDRTVEGIPSVMGILDLANDKITNRAFKKTIRERSEKVRHLWQHDNYSPPIAKILNLEEIGREDLPKSILKKYPEATGGLKVTRRDLETERGNEVLAGIKAGAINEMSIGYDAIKVEFTTLKQDNRVKVPIRVLKEVALWDTSDVNWGMNPATAAVAGKQVIPYQETGIHPKDTPMGDYKVEDFSEEIFEVLPVGEQQRIANHFAWVTVDNVTEFKELRLLHHVPGKEGRVGPANWLGVVKSMSKLMLDVTVPAENRKEIYGHLAGHYKEFGETPPSFYYVELINSAKRFKVQDESIVPVSNRVNEAVEIVHGSLATIFWMRSRRAWPWCATGTRRRRRAGAPTQRVF